MLSSGHNNLSRRKIYIYNICGHIDRPSSCTIKRISERKRINEKKNQGRCSWRVLPGFGFFQNQICSVWREGKYDVDLRLILREFYIQVSSFVRSTTVYSTTFRRDLLHLKILITESAALQLSRPSPSSRLRVVFYVSWVVSIYLSDLSISLRLLLLASFAISLRYV